MKEKKGYKIKLSDISIYKWFYKVARVRVKNPRKKALSMLKNYNEARKRREIEIQEEKTKHITIETLGNDAVLSVSYGGERFINLTENDLTGTI